MSEIDSVNRPPIAVPEPDPSRDAIIAAPTERFQKLLGTVKSGSPKTIRDLAYEFNLSASRLQHLFKAQTGSCLGRSLTEEKLRRAAALLLETNLSVKELAYVAGYKHPSSFIRAFERFFGQTPSRYRQRMEGSDNELGGS